MLAVYCCLIRHLQLDLLDLLDLLLHPKACLLWQHHKPASDTCHQGFPASQLLNVTASCHRKMPFTHSYNITQPVPHRSDIALTAMEACGSA